MLGLGRSEIPHVVFGARQPMRLRVGGSSGCQRTNFKLYYELLTVWKIGKAECTSPWRFLFPFESRSLTAIVTSEGIDSRNVEGDGATDRALAERKMNKNQRFIFPTSFLAP